MLIDETKDENIDSLFRNAKCGTLLTRTDITDTIRMHSHNAIKLTTKGINIEKITSLLYSRSRNDKSLRNELIPYSCSYKAYNSQNTDR